MHARFCSMPMRCGTNGAPALAWLLALLLPLSSQKGELNGQHLGWHATALTDGLCTYTDEHMEGCTACALLMCGLTSQLHLQLCAHRRWCQLTCC